MSREDRETKATVGFRVKSGWATAVLLVGPVSSPQVLCRRIVELSDPAVPETQQPYHAGMGLLEEDEATISSRTAIVQRVAALSVKATLDDFATAGHRTLRAGLVVGSLTDPRSISNPHIRAHALEGQLFRSVLARALEAHGLTCSVVLERDAYTKAATTLALSEDDVKRAVSALGRSLGGPWRAEEKLAALVAWMNLS
jgi:hypothetical protein